MFEEYLKEKHAEDYKGTDDDMPEAYDSWLAGLDTETLIGFGNDAMEKQSRK